MKPRDRNWIAERIAMERIADRADLWMDSATVDQTDANGNIWVTVRVRIDREDIDAVESSLGERCD